MNGRWASVTLEVRVGGFSALLSFLDTDVQLEQFQWVVIHNVEKSIHRNNDPELLYLEGE